MAGNIPLDPSKWESPKETFIGRLKVCSYGTTDDSKTKEGETFTAFYGWPRAGQTWRTEVERLDAVFVNKVTGEESPVHRYQTLNLERFDDRKKLMVPVTQGDNKASFIIEQWVKAKVRLAPDPALNEGLIAEFCVERTHKFGNNMAKNLLYPVKVLATGEAAGVYEYRGDVERIEFDPDRGDGQSLDEAAGEIAKDGGAGANGAKAGAGKGEDIDIIGLLVGVSAEDEDAVMAVVAANKGKLPASAKQALLSGAFVQEALDGGKLVVVDGAYAKA